MAITRNMPVRVTRHREYQTTAAGTLNFEIENKAGYENLALRLFADSESGTSTVDLKVQGYCETAQKYYDIPGASLVQISANMTDPIDLLISPNAAAVANRVVSRPLPSRLRVVMVVGGTSFKVALESEQF